jgi:hypothetical protein
VTAPTQELCFDECVQELPALPLFESPEPLPLVAGHTEAGHLQKLGTHPAYGLFRYIRGGTCKF